MRKTLAILSLFLIFSTSNATQAFRHGMVVSESRLASQAGIDILRNGGNAIDAAVAVGYALAVVNPCCGNIGGGGFMVIHLANGKNVFLNFREKAPLKATKNMYLDAEGKVIANQSTKGYSSVAVPGTVLGLDTALKRYGTMTRHQVMAPAIRLAQRGYIVTDYEANQFNKYADDFREQVNVTSIFLKNDEPYKPGDRLIQNDLAHTLQLIAEKGADAFYKGAIAKTIVLASEKNGGKLSLADFANYSVDQSTPSECHYRGYTILSTPQPKSGGSTLCQMLAVLQKNSLRQAKYGSVESIKEIVEAMRHGFTQRNETPLPAKTFRQHELTDTTHYSIIDKNGNAVAVTYTLNGFFGARVIAGNTGFFLNNEMDDFTVKPGVPNNFNLLQSESNAIQPGKRPLSSMTPTIVLKDKRLFMVIGSPGGPRIITAVLLTLLNTIDYDMTLQDATNAPRIHYQVFPNTLYIEPSALSSDVITALEKLGYKITQQHTWGAIEAIRVDATGYLQGANDYRRPDGAALGY